MVILETPGAMEALFDNAPLAHLRDYALFVSERKTRVHICVITFFPQSTLMTGLS